MSGEVFTGFGWETRRKETTERPKHRWEDNIKMYPREKGIDEVNWNQLAQDMV
jgi:hypothetical protein